MTKQIRYQILDLSKAALCPVILASLEAASNMGGRDAGGRICAMNATILDNKLNWTIRSSPLSFSFELSGENWGLASTKPAHDSIPEGRSSNSSMGVSASSQTSESLGVGYSLCPVRYGYIHISFQGTLPF